MIIEFTEHGWEDFAYWLENDPAVAVRIKELLKDITRTPFKGVGKPEPLKHALKGFWSRRISREHRLVYRVSGKRGVDQKVSIIQCRFHYEK
jgi:toxin YoeB